jgi:hypothetical protein
VGGTAVWLGGALVLVWLSAVSLPPVNTVIAAGLVAWVLVGAARWAVPLRLAPGSGSGFTIVRGGIRVITAFALAMVLSDLYVRFRPAFTDEHLTEFIVAVHEGRKGTPHATLRATPEQMAEARRDFTPRYDVLRSERAAFNYREVRVRFTSGAEYTIWASPDRDSEGRWRVFFK